MGTDDASREPWSIMLDVFVCSVSKMRVLHFVAWASAMSLPVYPMIHLRQQIGPLRQTQPIPDGLLLLISDDTSMGHLPASATNA